MDDITFTKFYYLHVLLTTYESESDIERKLDIDGLQIQNRIGLTRKAKIRESPDQAYNHTFLLEKVFLRKNIIVVSFCFKLGKTFPYS